MYISLQSEGLRVGAAALQVVLAPGGGTCFQIHWVVPNVSLYKLRK